MPPDVLLAPPRLVCPQFPLATAHRQAASQTIPSIAQIVGRRSRKTVYSFPNKRVHPGGSRGMKSSGIFERLIARAVVKICLCTGHAPASFGRCGLLALAILSWHTVGCVSRLSANVVAFDPGVKAHRTLISRALQVAEKSQFHIRRDYLIPHTPVLPLCWPKNT
jgi:hypothetical protein